MKNADFMLSFWSKLQATTGLSFVGLKVCLLRDFKQFIQVCLFTSLYLDILGHILDSIGDVDPEHNKHKIEKRKLYKQTSCEFT